MVRFDASVAGTSAATWAADARLHNRPPLQLEGIDEVLVVAAHPDDETLGAGALIAECVRRGIPVRVIVVTDGGASGDQGIVERRSNELSAATAVLGATAECLWLPDGATREHRDELRAALAPLIAGSSRRALIVAPWRGDGHRDHRVVGEVVAELVGPRRLIEYPIWMWHWSGPADAPWTSLVSMPAGEQKVRAIDEYHSQTEGDHPVLRDEFLDNFRSGVELFIEAPGALRAEYFDETYARHDDPWGFETRWYEQRKRALTMAILPERRYGRALEIGCSIGVLSNELADRVDALLAVDVSQAAVDRARARLGDRAMVELLDVVEDFPSGAFDLVVLSEVGYYFGAALERVLDDIEAAIGETGTLVACHWRHPVPDYPLVGDEVHERIRARGLTMIAIHLEEDFVLEVFSRDLRSVAARTGLL